MQIGVLIIGSLLWDTSPGRESWRRSRLDINGAKPVAAPIRYGRRSSSRGDTYTMTFDDTDRAGTAKLVPFRDPVETPEGLIEEAQELWKAEQPNAQQGMVGASWGCVGVSVPRELPLEWREAWSNYFREHTRKAIPPVGDDGRLDIPWPQDAEHLDVILATATKPKPPHVTAIDVAHAWIDQDEGHERYFFENVRHGIRTPDDHTIWQRIQERPPRWLGDSRYREAIDLLNRQP